jgi:hypothetical protein
MTKIPSVITSAMLWQELQEVKSLLKIVTKDHLEMSIEEVSLHKASKLLRLGQATIIKLIKTGDLKARTYKTNGQERYRIRIADIRIFQEQKSQEAENIYSLPLTNNKKPLTMKEVISNAYKAAGVDPTKPKRQKHNLL